ncbi:MAG: DUF1697 domain-containing protein [Polyangiaceae bacterium]|nr:DUF1697 domain-containing protein [Polyangiaceae bacterium]
MSRQPKPWSRAPNPTASAEPVSRAGGAARRSHTGELAVRVALLRGVNVSGVRKVPMGELRALAAGLGFTRAETYVQSGNLVLTTTRDDDDVAGALERALSERFGFEVPVVVRGLAAWDRWARGSTFADAETARPQWLLLALSRRPLPARVVTDLAPYVGPAERVALAGGGLWIDYGAGVARSRLTPAVLDRVAGAPVTARNVRTVRALATLGRQLAAG